MARKRTIATGVGAGIGIVVLMLFVASSVRAVSGLPNWRPPSPPPVVHPLQVVGVTPPSRKPAVEFKPAPPIPDPPPSTSPQQTSPASVTPQPATPPPPPVQSTAPVTAPRTSKGYCLRGACTPHLYFAQSSDKEIISRAYHRSGVTRPSENTYWPKRGTPQSQKGEYCARGICISSFDVPEISVTEISSSNNGRQLLFFHISGKTLHTDEEGYPVFNIVAEGWGEMPQEWIQHFKERGLQAKWDYFCNDPTTNSTSRRKDLAGGWSFSIVQIGFPRNITPGGLYAGTRQHWGVDCKITTFSQFGQAVTKDISPGVVSVSLPSIDRFSIESPWGSFERLAVYKFLLNRGNRLRLSWKTNYSSSVVIQGGGGLQQNPFVTSYQHDEIQLGNLDRGLHSYIMRAKNSAVGEGTNRPIPTKEVTINVTDPPLWCDWSIHTDNDSVSVYWASTGANRVHLQYSSGINWCESWDKCSRTRTEINEDGFPPAEGGWKVKINPKDAHIKLVCENTILKTSKEHEKQLGPGTLELMKCNGRNFLGSFIVTAGTCCAAICETGAGAIGCALGGLGAGAVNHFAGGAKLCEEDPNSVRIGVTAPLGAPSAESKPYTSGIDGGSIVKGLNPNPESPLPSAPILKGPPSDPKLSTPPPQNSGSRPLDSSLAQPSSNLSSPIPQGVSNQSSIYTLYPDLQVPKHLTGKVDVAPGADWFSQFKGEDLYLENGFTLDGETAILKEHPNTKSTWETSADYTNPTTGGTYVKVWLRDNDGRDIGAMWTIPLKINGSDVPYLVPVKDMEPPYDKVHYHKGNLR